jgi:tetratricopeptide (TPR) repeat protein
MAGERHAALVAVRTLDSLNPGTKATYNHGVEALENGFVEEAISTLRSLTPERGAMRGWIPYYEVTGSAYHIAGRFSDELSIGEQARRQYPDRMYALLPSIRSLAALDRLPMLSELLQRAALLPNDPYGTSLEQLYVEAGDELRAHGDGEHARSYYAKALDIIRSGSEKGIARLTESKQRLAIRAAAERGLSLWPELAITAASLIKLDSAEPDYRGILGVTLVHTGKRSDAVALRNSIENDRRPYRFGRAPVAAARIATALGTTGDAIADLSRAFAEGRQFDLWVHRDADFDTLRPIASFQKIVALRQEH